MVSEREPFNRLDGERISESKTEIFSALIIV